MRSVSYGYVCINKCEIVGGNVWWLVVDVLHVYFFFGLVLY